MPVNRGLGIYLTLCFQYRFRLERFLSLDAFARKCEMSQYVCVRACVRVDTSPRLENLEMRVERVYVANNNFLLFALKKSESDGRIGLRLAHAK